ncbi:hypothetical protein [Paenibacillus silvae]|uniref:hypothetical protein n=1 Tax=Paenibacillus silvae TaxID=1325358 RepID=UPI002002BE06|nr:hypothetical protein [Paenibacillus silvae]MCK6075883.1 hypothetical protein [Paenibacillus silvae]MCK6150272.1 hypothetical protein [Paenibacillus silvae]MCK6268570.1 hypothetical protein [Paenibacillus silvae]
MKYILILILVIISGCGEKLDREQSMSTADLLANETIQADPSADLFLYNDRVYIRKNKIDNIDQLGDLLGKIQDNYVKDAGFKDLMSTQLPVGTEIYQLKQEESIDQLIVKNRNKLIIYEALPEG